MQNTNTVLLEANFLPENPASIYLQQNKVDPSERNTAPRRVQHCRSDALNLLYLPYLRLVLDGIEPGP